MPTIDVDKGVVMRRKSDMWQELDEQGAPFLPEVGAQQTQTAVADVTVRLDTVERQLLSQYTSVAAYAQIAQQSVDTARAEARADLDREKATLISLVERVRSECMPEGPHATSLEMLQSASFASADGETKRRLDALEGKFDRMNQLFAQCLRNQEELANSIAALLERQMRDQGWPAPIEPVEALSLR